MNPIVNPNTFHEFLSFFPKTDLPLTIQYSDYHSFSKVNDALPDELLAAFVLPNLDFEVDEFTEFLPCLQFEADHGMHHIVIWTARLLHYSFYLMNFNSKGVFLHLAEVAGFYTENDMIFQKMAHIDVEANMLVLEGSMTQNQLEVNPNTTKKWQLEILPDGQLRVSEIKL
ncbi:MAG: hypothetical protein IPO78_01970 [Saprospiraceae bacterium]|nr:hypothetical protein [Saprospiraceae bacterium]MBK8450537.1 hypothetical protein [Saprospiraceae bacterium]MBK9222599.1 hypothetical protein [Saprospiraceae bacterium]MBK9720368.1 hypothetical protein [Saprospiraceae bacterium]